MPSYTRRIAFRDRNFRYSYGKIGTISAEKNEKLKEYIPEKYGFSYNKKSAH